MHRIEQKKNREINSFILVKHIKLSSFVSYIILNIKCFGSVRELS